MTVNRNFWKPSSCYGRMNAMVWFAFMVAVVTFSGLIVTGPFVGCKSEPKSSGIDLRKKDAVRTKNVTESLLQFVDRTSDSGVDAICQNGGDAEFRTMLETLGGGVGIVDFDRDGMADFFVNGGGLISKAKEISGAGSFLYRNLGDWKFLSCIEKASVDTSRLYNHACQFGDIDNDGFQDLVVTGYLGIEVYRNQGDGSFLRMDDCGIRSDRWSTSAAFADIDNDGCLDLYVANYLKWSFDKHKVTSAFHGKTDVASPRGFESEQDFLFVSNQDWTFRMEAKSRGIEIENPGKGLGVVAADIDLDGDTDIYVANDVTDNLLFENDGTGRFVEMGNSKSVALGNDNIPNGSMGVGVCDFDNDGLPDIGVANFESEQFALYRQVKRADKKFFVFDSEKRRLAASNQMYVGWGTVFLDLDGDFDQELVTNNGNISYFPKNETPMRQPPVLFENLGSAFERKEKFACEYLTQLHHGRGLAAADFDNDGDWDLLFGNCNENCALLENTTSLATAMTPHLFIGIQGNRDGIGSTFKIERDRDVEGGKSFVRSIVGGGSYLSSGEKFLLLPDLNESGSTASVSVQSGGKTYVGLKNGRYMILFDQ